MLGENSPNTVAEQNREITFAGTALALALVVVLFPVCVGTVAAEDVSVEGKGPVEDVEGDSTVVPQTSHDQFEQNNDFSNAATVSPGTYTGLEIQNGESDYFAVNLQELATLTATIDFSHSTGDLDLKVYGPSPGQTQLDSSFSTSDD